QKKPSEPPHTTPFRTVDGSANPGRGPGATPTGPRPCGGRGPVPSRRLMTCRKSTKSGRETPVRRSQLRTGGELEVEGPRVRASKVPSRRCRASEDIGPAL